MKFLGWICLIAACACFQLEAGAQEAPLARGERDQLIQRGMWREALDHYAEKLLPISDASSGVDLEQVVESLRQLDAWSEFDEIMEGAVSTHPENPELLIAAAAAYQGAPHAGQIIAGDFIRGGGQRFGRGPPGMNVEASAGHFVSTEFRDRVRALQLLREALTRATDQRLQAWEQISRMLITTDAWKLQTLTPLDTLPGWSEPGPEGGTEGAPWNKDGPVVYEIPASWEAAINDGQRWRFALAEQVRLSDEKRKAETILARAKFSESQFGTQTLAAFQWWRQQNPDGAKGILEMDTLTEDECLAQTSDGVRRFKLPPEHHFIALYRSILDDKTQGGGAGDALVSVFLNRRQYDRARTILEQTIARHGPGAGNARKTLLKQITGNWGRFEPAVTVPTGTKPILPLVFRNASNIKLTAAPIDMESVLRDTVGYLKSNPRDLDWQRLSPAQIGQRLIAGKDAKYIGKNIVSWETQLSPRDRHRDTLTELEVPVRETGAWWITGKVEGGNSFHTLVWIVSSVIVEKDVGGEKQWWVVDAATGAPLAESQMDFFGFRVVQEERKQPGDARMEIRTKSFARETDADGRTLVKPSDLDSEYQWLVTARRSGRAAAFHGILPFSVTQPEFENENRDLSYGISDRPLYQPGDTAHLKFYLRNVGYFQPDDSRWANKTGVLVVTNGRGEEVIKVDQLKTDDLGAVAAEIVIPKDGVLGTWSANFRIDQGVSAAVSLRVEEYRKPEYEVVVEAPAAPIKLGEKFTATIKATYFHGAPVRNASVEVIVKRGTMGERWFPPGRWDWLYGPGSWWSGSEAIWHPTWERWGCIPPHPPWWRDSRWTPDELVMKRSIAIGPDGTAMLEIDTAPAKEIHGDRDARYTLEARVVDASRREERGSGTVIAARRPFEVFVWTDRGYTRAGEEVEASISAATLAGKPVVAARGTLKLLRLTIGEDGRVTETEAQSWPIETDSEGEIRQKFAAPAVGQYRLAASLSFAAGEAVEGATILNVHGNGSADPADWKFGPLELIADKATYAPGETAKIRVNSDQDGANVWLFLHIAGTSGREARRVQLNGKSVEVEVPLDLRDMPNMFIEGITVHGAKVHSAVRQILMPPVSKLIEVTVEPSKARVKPRESSSLRVTLRDADGKPLSGRAVVTIYDKSLEALTGGSNVGSIHENFWSWKNNFYDGGGYDTIPRSPGNLLKENAPQMQPLNISGDSSNNPDMFGMEAKGGVQEMAMPATMEARALDSASPAPAASPILIRKDFADLLKWSGEVQTDADGRAEIPLEFPDNLTTWKARVWVLGKGTQVGEGSAEIITSKELLVRLQAPRFLVERDESVLSAVVQNDHGVPKTVKVSLELEGDSLQAIDSAPQTIEIAAKSEARVEWRVKALREGEVTLRMRADAGDDGDAVERKLPVRVHGMLRQDAWSRTVEPGVESASMEIDVPAERRSDQSRLTIRFSPTIAGAVVDAIPYLADYPHQSSENTLNRFVPAVIARRMLKDLDINLAEVKGKRTNLNPQELGHPADRAAQWKQWQTNPVFDEVELDKMVAQGVDKLMTMQNSDGGWGWFSGHGETSYPHMTAIVVHGLLIARKSGTEIPDDLLAAGVAWLAAYERKQAAALQLHVEREALRAAGHKAKDSHKYEKSTSDALDAFVRLVLGEAELDSAPMLAFLHRDRIELPVYAKCLLGLEHHRKGDEARRDEVMQMISQYLKRDPENQTTYLALQNQNYWWNWYGSDVEAHAWYLKLLAAVKPDDADTRGLVKYLVNNRKHASYWDSTRDTAFAIEAIASYFKASGKGAPEMEVDVLLDGKSLRKVSINRENLFSFDGTVTLTGDAVTGGKHRVELRRSGKGTLYTNAYLEVFTLEDRLRAAGLEVKVSRRISKLIPMENLTSVPDSTGLVSMQNVGRFRRELLADGAKLNPGDRVEVELILESKNDYEYLVFSDAKAAGFEAVDALSGYIDSGGFRAYMEPRDKTVDFFIHALPRGTHTLRYQLRAEAPGIYKALPATVEGVYAPELRGNSDDLRLEISNEGSLED